MSNLSRHLADLSGKLESDGKSLESSEGADQKETPTNLVEESVESLQHLQRRNVTRRSTMFVKHDEVQIPKDHDRIFSALNEDTCEELIAGFTAAGKQTEPAIVRPNSNGQSSCKFELVTGARRYWVSRHLKKEFLIEVRDLSDVEAFELNDIDNRARKDVTDYERGRKYSRALKTGMYRDQNELAERLAVSASTCSRLITIGSLPEEIANVFASYADIKIDHAKTLSPLLRSSKTKSQVMKRAANLDGRKREGESLTGPMVVRYLSGEKVKEKIHSRELKSSSGRKVGTIESKNNGLVIKLNVANEEKKELEKKLEAALCKVFE